MLKTFKIMWMILALGIFLLPKSIAAMTPESHRCASSVQTENCCSKSEKKDCHTDSSEKSPMTDCDGSCSDCGACTGTTLFTPLTPQIELSREEHRFAHTVNFGYKPSFFSSAICAIWQPPKIA